MGIVTGIYPKSENLRKVIGRWQRGVSGAGELDEALENETKRYEDISNGVSINCDPLFNWFDIFRPLLTAISGFSVGPLRRFEETNTFYREPSLESLPVLNSSFDTLLEASESLPLPLFRSNKNSSACFPGPETFFSMSSNTGNLSKPEFINSLVKSYSEILSKTGRNSAVIMERVSPGADSIKAFNKHLSGKKIFLYATGPLEESSFRGTDQKLHSIIAKPEFAGIATAHSQIPGFELVDAHNTRMESPKEILDKFAKLSHGNGIIAPTDYLDFLPSVIADRKVALLSEVVS